MKRTAECTNKLTFAALRDLKRRPTVKSLPLECEFPVFATTINIAA